MDKCAHQRASGLAVLDLIVLHDPRRCGILWTTEGQGTYSTVFRWLDTNAEFRNKYARAREIQGHIAADMAVEVAVNATDAGLGRLAYDAQKWQASKLAPKVYGDKSEVVMSGPNGGAIQNETKLSLDPMEAMRTYQRVMGEDK